ncbi:TonB-dependent receptor domain-containing protein [Paucibacter soli]|uniref:TonB-dependent receptor domain-containing protein n=1 Tax=Paucibacter soli TaxID=3133433 RepID=UPI0030ACC7CD
MKLTPIAQCLARCLALTGLAAPLLASAQSTAPVQRVERVEITGSSIKRIKDEGSLPVQVISAAQLERAGIVTAEQLISTLTSNGNGLDNMASQSDVVAGDARGNNGASFANLRGQGSRNTLVLLNGRRVASHGLNGTAVNLNTIPMTAVERIEVLKDGASAIYGTDAIGGVINFILRRDLSGLQMQAFSDLTTEGGGHIYRLSASGGVGNLASDGYNAMFAVARTENEILKGTQRSGFVNTFQPDRGLSVDTRGTPVATVFARAGLTTILSPSSSGVLLPGGTQRYNGINPLAMPGGAGCASMPNSMAYDAKLWASPGTEYGCAWDTGVSATLQQPVENTSLVARFSKSLGEHLFTAELVSGKVHSSKSFSEVQLISSATNRYLYPSSGASYNSVFNAIAQVFPSILPNKGNPIAFRWRCMDCGPRQIETETESRRIFAGIDGPVAFLKDWDYKAGLSSAFSEDKSTLGTGYYYRDGMVAAIGSGALNPFAMPGQQTAAGLSALAAASAKGLALYGGKFTVTQADASATGPLFKLPAGEVMAAVGIDARREKFSFKGEDGAPNGQVIIAAPFDGSNAVNGVKRDVKAIYAELLVPILKNLEFTAAARTDDYTGFGKSTNPKFSLRYTPMQEVLVRGSYNTGFRVPTFSQALNGPTKAPFDGKDLADPKSCASGVVNPAVPGCAAVFPDIISGGNNALGPETAKSGTVGIVLSPWKDTSIGLDWWTITRNDAIRTPSLTELKSNYALFQDRFWRDASGALVAVDQRWFNAGGAKTSGLELNLASGGKIFEGQWAASLDGSYLLDKKSRISNSDPWGPSQLGQFNRYDDPGIRWKHVATLAYSQGPWVNSLTQRYTGGYTDAVLPGVANGTVTPPNWSAKVKPYISYDYSVTYSGIKDLSVTVGLKNIFGANPPFSAYYDADLGSGSSWDPRVADPRGRSLTMLMKYAFK